MRQRYPLQLELHTFRGTQKPKPHINLILLDGQNELGISFRISNATHPYGIPGSRAQAEIHTNRLVLWTVRESPAAIADGDRRSATRLHIDLELGLASVLIRCAELAGGKLLVQVPTINMCQLVSRGGRRNTAQGGQRAKCNQMAHVNSPGLRLCSTDYSYDTPDHRHFAINRDGRLYIGVVTEQLVTAIRHGAHPLNHSEVSVRHRPNSVLTIDSDL